MKHIALALLIAPVGASAQENYFTPEFVDKLAKDLSDTYTTQPLNGAMDRVRKAISNTALNSLTTIADDAKLHAGASEATPVTERLSAGVDMIALDRVGEWYAVQSPTDPKLNGWLNADSVQLSEIPAWYRDEQARPLQSEETQKIFQDQMVRLLEKAGRLKASYDGSSVIEITGFAVEMSLTGPALSMNFDFR